MNSCINDAVRCFNDAVRCPASRSVPSSMWCFRLAARPVGSATRIVGLAARRVAPVSRTEVQGSRRSAHVSRSVNHVPRMLVHAAETLARGSRKSLVDCGTFFTCLGALVTACGPSSRAEDHCASLAGCSSRAEDHCAPLAGRLHVPRTIGHRSRVVLHVSRAIFQPNGMGRVRSEPALSVAGADPDVAGADSDVA